MKDEIIAKRNLQENNISSLDKNKFSNTNKKFIEEENKSHNTIISITKSDILNKEKLIKLIEKINPKLLEFYEIKEYIGSGSESVVYKAIHKKTNKPCAIKILIMEGKRNLSEYIILHKLKNKNIINYYGIYEIKKNELDCIIMEYAKFGNLREFKKNILKRENLSEQLLCFLVYQILNGLYHCHKCKIAHFDLKPQNIIIDEYLIVKIIDFSVSVDYSGIKSNSIKLPFRGTNFYIAPEVIKKKTININDLNKVDLYSLGVIIYYLAFGTYPYDLNRDDSDNYDKIYNKIENNNLVFDNEENFYSKYFIDFLNQLLEKDINKRININQALNHYWIKGADILYNEKEKCFNASSFLINLMTDHFINFDKYVKN